MIWPSAWLWRFRRRGNKWMGHIILLNVELVEPPLVETWTQTKCVRITSSFSIVKPNSLKAITLDHMGHKLEDLDCKRVQMLLLMCKLAQGSCYSTSIHHPFTCIGSLDGWKKLKQQHYWLRGVCMPPIHLNLTPMLSNIHIQKMLIGLDHLRGVV